MDIVSITNLKKDNNTLHTHTHKIQQDRRFSYTSRTIKYYACIVSFVEKFEFRCSERNPVLEITTENDGCFF